MNAATPSGITMTSWHNCIPRTTNLPPASPTAWAARNAPGNSRACSRPIVSTNPRWPCTRGNACDAASVQRFQFAGQRIGPLRDGAGPQADDIIARFRQTRDDAGELLRSVERDHLPVTTRAQGLHQMIAIGALDRRFAGGIDIG